MAKKPKVITRISFLAALINDINQFNTYWKEQRAANPKHFPDKMSRGDWEEQFLAFDSSKKGE